MTSKKKKNPKLVPMTEAEAYAEFAYDLREHLRRVQAELELVKSDNAALRQRLAIHVVEQRRVR